MSLRITISFFSAAAPTFYRTSSYRSMFYYWIVIFNQDQCTLTFTRKQYQIKTPKFWSGPASNVQTRQSVSLFILSHKVQAFSFNFHLKFTDNNLFHIFCTWPYIPTFPSINFWFSLISRLALLHLQIKRHFSSNNFNWTSELSVFPYHKY